MNSTNIEKNVKFYVFYGAGLTFSVWFLYTHFHRKPNQVSTGQAWSVGGLIVIYGSYMILLVADRTLTNNFLKKLTSWSSEGILKVLEIIIAIATALAAGCAVAIEAASSNLIWWHLVLTISAALLLTFALSILPVWRLRQKRKYVDEDYEEGFRLFSSLVVTLGSLLAAAAVISTR